MDKFKAIKKLRKKLKDEASVGSWMQIPSSSIAEVVGDSGYDWAAIDMEHGQISFNSLPDLFRALELGNTLPLVRVAQPCSNDCKLALEAGASGIIIPLIESADQFIAIRDFSRWPPNGNRGVGFSRANLFGKYFNEYYHVAQNPFLVAMIESKKGLDNIDEILGVEGLDAVLIGPYDLSASLGQPGDFNNEEFKSALISIKQKCNMNKIPCGIHVVEASEDELKDKIAQGYRFIPYSLDTVILRTFLDNPIK